ncbi:MAG: hypothetical protein QOK21_623 [Solirubrobacteraceae bacterium]|nr:hypothetical protein [Solirubrobacteraceae bacterium]
MTRVRRLDHVVLKVTDMDAAAAFYADVLGAERLELEYGRVGLRVGEIQINLHGPSSTPHPLPAHVPEPGGADLCFAWDGSPESACDHVRGHGLEPVLGPVPRTGAQGPGTSVYFRDPDGNLLELIAY